MYFPPGSVCPISCPPVTPSACPTTMPCPTCPSISSCATPSLQTPTSTPGTCM